jgi:hypothetical protein
VEEEGRAEGAGERLDVGEVVAVVVRDDDGVDAPGEEIGAEIAQAGREDARAEAGVDDDASAVVGLEEHGVARRAAAEDEHAHGR